MTALAATDPLTAHFVPDAHRGLAHVGPADDDLLPSVEQLTRRYTAAAHELRRLDPIAPIPSVRFTPGLIGEGLRRWKRRAFETIEDIEARVADLRAEGRDPRDRSPRRDAIERRYMEVRNKVRAMTVSQHGAHDPIFLHQAAALFTGITSLGVASPNRWISIGEADRQSEARLRGFEGAARELYADIRRGPPPRRLPPAVNDDTWNVWAWRTEMVWRLHSLQARARILVNAWRDDDPALAGRAQALLDELGLSWGDEETSPGHADGVNAARLGAWERLLAQLELRPIPPPLPPGVARRQAFDGTWRFEVEDPAAADLEAAHNMR